MTVDAKDVAEGMQKELNKNRYAGLTNDPDERKKKHLQKYPIMKDWWVRPEKFEDEDTARAWEKHFRDQGYDAEPGGAGWKYGYTFTKK